MICDIELMGLQFEFKETKIQHIKLCRIDFNKIFCSIYINSIHNT